MRGLHRDSRSEPSRPGEAESISFFSYDHIQIKIQLRLCLNDPVYQRGTISSRDIKSNSEILVDMLAEGSF